jgi:hypothetical protein
MKPWAATQVISSGGDTSLLWSVFGCLYFVYRLELGLDKNRHLSQFLPKPDLPLSFDCTRTTRIGGPVAYAEHAGHEALGGYPGDFLWGRHSLYFVYRLELGLDKNQHLSQFLPEPDLPLSFTIHLENKSLDQPVS